MPVPTDQKWCERCKRYHNSPPVDVNKIIDEKAKEIADHIDAQVMEMLRNAGS